MVFMYACPKAAHAYTFKHAGSGHKRPRAGKKSAAESSRDQREKKKVSSQPNITPLQLYFVLRFFLFLSLVHNSYSFLFLSNLQAEVKQLKAEIEELKKSNSRLEGQAFELRKFLEKTDENLKETREENSNLKIVQKSQSDSILELEKVVFFLHKLIFSHNLGRVYICLLCHTVKCCYDSIWFKSGNLFIVNYIEYT